MTSLRTWVAAALLGALLAGCSTSSPPTTSPKEAPGPNLNGIYTIETGPYLEYVTDKTRPVDTYSAAFRSTCTDGRCLATQIAVDNENKPVPGAPSRVLDFVGGNWRWSGEVDGTCTTSASDQPLTGRYFKSMSLAPQPDGTLVGTLVTLGGMDPCHVANHAGVKLTRVGELDPGVSLPDPISLAAPVASPAAGLHGSYDYHYTDRALAKELPVTRAIASTYCTRTGTKCATLVLFLNDQRKPTNFQVLGYAGERWTSTMSAGEESCAATGGTVTKTVATEFALPMPPTDPISKLTGVETTTWVGPCPAERSNDVVLNRTGD